MQLVVANWQWAAAAAVGLISLALGGWLQSRQAEPPESTPPAQEEPPSVNPLAEQVEALQEQLKSAAAQQLEVQDAREESELLLLQLHQVQEELEHYFLLSQELQQQLEQVPSKPELVPSEQLETMRSIKQRLLNLILERPDAEAGDPAVRALLQRQQQALRRFAALHQQPHEPRPEAPSRPKLLSADDELVFL